MEENNQTIIDIKIPDALIDSLKMLREEYAKNAEQLQKYNAQLQDGTITQEQYDKAVIEVTQEQKVLRQEISGVEKQMQNEIKAQKANTDSLVQMRAQLANLNKQYDSMSGFERMGVEGLALRDKIAALSHEIQGLEEDTGRWQRNVGNYKSALKGMKDATEAAGLSSKGLDRIMKGLSANPWMTVVTALVTILVKLRDRLKDNEQVTKSLGNAMSSLQPVFDWFNKIISKIADVFSNVLDWAIQKVIQSLGWLGRQLQKLGAAFGKDWGSGLVAYSETMKQTTDATTEAATATETLSEGMTNIAKSSKDAREELLKLINELPTLEQNLKKAAEQQQKLRDKIVEAYMSVYGKGKLSKDEMLDPKAYNKYSTDDSYIETLERRSHALTRFADEYKENAQTIEAVSSSLQSSFGSLSSIYKQMSEDETKSEAEREAAAKKAKTWSALQIAANSGTAIAKGVAASMDKPFPANLAALASTLAAVIAAVAQAKALAAEGHEHGGVIGGTFTGATRGGDNVVMTGRRSELVLNADQQKRLFDIANGSQSPSLAAELAAAIRQMPAPRLALQELNDYQSKVVTFDETQLIH